MATQTALTTLSNDLADAVARGASLRDALSMMMSDSMRPIRVTGEDGRTHGFVSIELINQTLHRGRTREVGPDLSKNTGPESAGS